MELWPVIHIKPGDPAEAESLVMQNAELALQHGCAGVFLIDMQGNDEPVPALARRVKNRYPTLKVGINLLSACALEALNFSLPYGLDATWTDSPGVTSSRSTVESSVIAQRLREYPGHLFFGSVAFKYQAQEENPPGAALAADALGMIATTSGVATGHAAPTEKLVKMRAALKDKPLGLASGLTPANVHEYAGLITHALVSTGISIDFFSFCPKALADMATAVARTTEIPKAPHACIFCGSPSWIDPSDQTRPPAYCHDSDHGPGPLKVVT